MILYRFQGAEALQITTHELQSLDVVEDIIPGMAKI
jgi:acetyl-CoA carboxylase alpha subunit